jgi:HlyD family secretion protein
MDIKREGVARKKLIRRAVYLLIAATVVVLTGWQVGQLKPAAPAVEMAAIWPGTVKRGPMVRDVRGLGTLVPEDILWIQAAFDSKSAKFTRFPAMT